jgi:hypothetical protein
MGKGRRPGLSGYLTILVNEKKFKTNKDLNIKEEKAC